MSFCSICGTKIENENTRFCPKCGCDLGIDATNTVPLYEQQPSVPVVQHEMKWFKFLIYFALFLGAFINFVSGFNYLVGTVYLVQTNGQVTSDMVYNFYGMGLKVLDVIYGLILIAFAGFSIYTRIRLAHYRANGPMCLMILYGAGAIVGLLYSVVASMVTGMPLGELISLYTVVSLITSVVMVLLNHTYFKKRKALFVN